MFQICSDVRFFRLDSVYLVGISTFLHHRCERSCHHSYLFCLSRMHLEKERGTRNMAQEKRENILAGRLILAPLILQASVITITTANFQHLFTVQVSPSCLPLLARFHRT
ncbi:hypothetical protein M405DRAFT_303328 [Rhizopogon salebrosus TDB-379]|nr:hypothetical protein M405DRAFT_303328 [Rhizopogon salebrosus TDB-379]